MKYDVINDVTDNLNETYIPKTELEKMIYKFKKTKWNWYSLSVNEKITIEFVVNNRHLLWTAFVKTTKNNQWKNKGVVYI